MIFYHEYLNKDLETKKTDIEPLFVEGKVVDSDINDKAIILQTIIEKLAEKENRWFELADKS
jgi:ABC transport system ATP-binding/permease protein